MTRVYEARLMRYGKLLVQWVSSNLHALAIRGFVMTQLQRAGVATWTQILVSGATIGSYCVLISWNYSLEYALSGFVLFSIIGFIYAIGKRSLTPSWIAHSMTHFFGDPSMMMGILVGAQFLLHLR